MNYPCALYQRIDQMKSVEIIHNVCIYVGMKKYLMEGMNIIQMRFKFRSGKRKFLVKNYLCHFFAGFRLHSIESN